MSIVNKRATSLVPNYVSKAQVVGDDFYDIDRLLSQLALHFDEDNTETEIEDEYRKLEVEENNLYFEITAEKDEKAALKLEYKDQSGDSLDHVEGKLEKVWNDRIEKVLERGRKNYD